MSFHHMACGPLPFRSSLLIAMGFLRCLHEHSIALPNGGSPCFEAPENAESVAINTVILSLWIHIPSQKVIGSPKPT